jgi:hypothetical protein
MASQEESPFRGLITSWPALAAMAVTMLSFWAANPRLESPRPTGGGVAPKLRLRVPEIPVRLWQDPLGSVAQGPPQNETKWFTNAMPGREQTGAPKKNLPGKDQDSKSKKVLILLALIESDLNPEQAETRRRERYAILSALNTAGYVPVQSERLSYVDLEHPPDIGASKKRSLAPGQSLHIFSQMANKPGKGSEEKSKEPEKKESGKDDPAKKDDPAPLDRIRMPFEWVRPLEGAESLQNPLRGAPHYSGVCVVWVYEDIYLSNSLHWLMYLKKTLEKTVLGEDKKGPACDFAITGRIISARLKTIITDDGEFKAKDEPSEALKDVPLYVTNSTAKSVRDLYDKIRTANDRKDKDGKPIADLPNSKLQPKFVIGSDAVLLQQLVAELRNRGIATKADQIAVIAEWDTGYGRDMHREFLEAAGFGNQKPPNVHLYSYLRGIDGKLPVRAEAAADDKEDTKNPKPSEASPDMPSAVSGEGDAQIDYLRRLIGRMKAESKVFRAIGILGSDPYDKLLILKAMRASFPEVLFFTTDLDVRMLQPAESAWTRNLVVAAHFGLTLKDDLQDKIPPFRSSYDTASYLGCLMAVGHPLLKKENLKNREKIDDGAHFVQMDKDGTGVPLPVHLYEVGRYGAFELTIHNKEQDPLGTRNYQRNSEYFDEHQGRIYFVPVVCAVLLGFLLLTVSRTWQRLLHLQPAEKPDDGAAPKLPWQGLFLVAVLFAAIVATVAILHAHYKPGEEPFSMVDGISIWPTVIFRLFAIALCVYYIWKTLDDLADRDAKIRKEFFPPSDPVTTAPTPPEPKSLWSASFGMWFWNPDHDNEQVVTVWAQFQDFGRWRNRFFRWGLAFGANVGLFFLLHSFFPWSRFHGRGDIGHWSAILTLYLAGGLLIWLLIFVVDTTVLCYRFVTYLSRFRGEWPQALLNTHAEQRGLTPTDASTDPTHAALSQLLRMRLIAMTTRVVSDLIFYPFVVLFVLFVAQNPLFVTWQWNLPVLSVALLSAGTALTCALIFQRSAKEARRKALDKLDEVLLPLAGKDDDMTRGKLLQIRADIEAMDSGVFAGFAQNPLVYAILLPLGGGGGLAALEALLPHL